MWQYVFLYKIKHQVPNLQNIDTNIPIYKTGHTINQIHAHANKLKDYLHISKIGFSFVTIMHICNAKLHF